MVFEEKQEKRKNSANDMPLPINPLPAINDFSCPLITYANSLHPDQNVGPDLDPNCLTF